MEGVTAVPAKPIKGFIPVEIDWDILQQLYPLPDKVTIDGLNFILVYMTGYTDFKPKKSSKKKEGNLGVPVNAKELRMVLSNEYVLHINYLVAIEILTKVKDKSVGNESRRYAFPEWYSGNIKEVTISDNNICKREHKRKQKNLQLSKERYPHLTEWFNSNLTFDIDAYNKYLRSYAVIAITNKATKWAKTYHRIAVMKLVNLDFTYSVDKSSGRFYSNLTNLPKRYRIFIRYSDQTLSAIDLSNSQLYFLAFLIKHLLERTDNNLLKKILQYTDTSVRDRVLKVVTELEVYSNLQSDIRSFSELVSAGEVYEFFGKLLVNNKFLNKDAIEIDRNFSKNMMLQFLFARPNSPRKEMVAVRGVFQNQWPTLYQFIYELKKERGQHRVLSVALQSIERYFFLDVMAKNYYDIYLKNNCNISNSGSSIPSPLLSVHDSLVVSSNRAQQLHSFMETTLFELTGIKPTLKIEHWR